jgi:hypothetical protein
VSPDGQGGLTRRCASCSLYRDPLMGAPASLLRDSRLPDLLHPSMDRLAAYAGVRMARYLPVAGFISEPIPEPELHRQDGGRRRTF